MSSHRIEQSIWGNLASRTHSFILACGLLGVMAFAMIGPSAVAAPIHVSGSFPFDTTAVARHDGICIDRYNLRIWLIGDILPVAPRFHFLYYFLYFNPCDTAGNAAMGTICTEFGCLDDAPLLLTGSSCGGDTSSLAICRPESTTVTYYLNRPMLFRIANDSLYMSVTAVDFDTVKGVLHSLTMHFDTLPPTVSTRRTTRVPHATEVNTGSASSYNILGQRLHTNLVGRTSRGVCIQRRGASDQTHRIRIR